MLRHLLLCLCVPILLCDLFPLVHQWWKPGTASRQQQTPELAHEGETSL